MPPMNLRKNPKLRVGPQNLGGGDPEWTVGDLVVVKATWETATIVEVEDYPGPGNYYVVQFGEGTELPGSHKRFATDELQATEA